MDETKARALVAGFELLDARTVFPDVPAAVREVLAFAVEVRREALDRAALAAVIHSQYPKTSDFDFGYDKGRKDAAAAIRALSDAPAATSKCPRCGQTVTNCRGCRDIRCPYSSVAAALALAEAP